MKNPTPDSLRSTSSKLWHLCRAVLCLLVAGCWWTTADRAHAQINTPITQLFYDQLNQSTTNGITTPTNPKNWYFGDTSTNVSPANGAIFTVTNINSSNTMTTTCTNLMTEEAIPGLEMVDSTNSNDPPMEAHTITGTNVGAIANTSNALLQLNIDLNESTNNTSTNQEYGFGLCNAPSGTTTNVHNVEAFQVWIWPNLSNTNNVYLETWNVSGTNAETYGFTAPTNSLLQGANTFSLQIDYRPGNSTPVLSVYSGGTLMGSTNSTVGGTNGGFTRSTTDGTNVQIFVMGVSGTTSPNTPTNALTNCNFTNVVLAAYTPAAFGFGSIDNATKINPLALRQNRAWAEGKALAAVGGFGDPATTPLGASVTGKISPVIQGLSTDLDIGAIRHGLDIRVPGKTNNTLDYSVGSISNQPVPRTPWDYGLDASATSARKVYATPVILCADYFFAFSPMPQNPAGLTGNLNASSTQQHP